MAATNVHLPTPTRDLVTSYIQQYNDVQNVVENALGKLIRCCPENRTFEDVLLKVVTLNDLYRTGILATYQVAEHIFRLQVDDAIKAGAPEIVHRIAHITLGEKERNNYSFATKYCAWHNPTAYAIYDRFVDQMLWGYQKQDRFAQFRQEDLRWYPRFMEVINAFRSHYQLEDVALKDIDKFLWLAGKQYYPAT